MTNVPFIQSTVLPRKNPRHQEHFHQSESGGRGDVNNNKTDNSRDNDDGGLNAGRAYFARVSRGKGGGGAPAAVAAAAAAGGGDGDVTDGARPITEADFNAVRPKTKNNYVGAKSSAQRKSKSATPVSPDESDDAMPEMYEMEQYYATRVR